MNEAGHWLFDLAIAPGHTMPDGLIAVDGGIDPDATPEHVLTLEKAREYGAHFVFFQARQDGRSGIPQAFVFIADGHADTEAFAALHQRLWSWGGVPLLYRATPGRVDLFRCAHQPDFLRPDGSVFYNPIDTLELAADIADASAWWSATRLRNGTLWDEPDVCDHLLSGAKAAHKSLVIAIKALAKRLNDRNVLNAKLRRRLLIISLLVAYLDERDALEADLFGRFKTDAKHFFEVLAHGPALVALLDDLHGRFNGQVFYLADRDKDVLRASGELDQFAELIEGYTEPNRQLSFWRLYSFRDLPVELISHIYQLFVDDPSSSIYTPPALVRLMIEEALSFERLDRLAETGEVILDPACGSGIFLVEAYKRLVLHWRSRHDWAKPNAEVLKHLMMQVHGVDLEDDAVELANFSLCLALCDALEPQTIRASLKLFPELSGNSLHGSCFFEALEKRTLTQRVGIILGNPPFISKLTTAAAARAYKTYKDEYGSIPDFQLAYLFLHFAMALLQPDGILCMLQQYGFLYNQKTQPFRRKFFEDWNVREILDFISVRNLFQKGGGDTKVIVLLASASPPQQAQRLLHAVFRRTGRASAGQGFDIDHYDLHWVDAETVRQDDAVWRANLFGGGRALALINRLKRYRTLADYASERQWRFGEGFAEGQRGVDKPAEHIHGHPYLPSTALTHDGVDRDAIAIYGTDPIEAPRSRDLFTPPMLLIREQMDLPFTLWTDAYLTYKNQIIGFAAPDHDQPRLTEIAQWLNEEADIIKAFVAGISGKLFTQKATSLTTADIFAIPYPEERSLDCSANERLVAQDMVDYYRDLIRRGDEAAVLRGDAADSLETFNRVFTRQINQIYADNPIRTLTPCRWQGILCQPYAFGKGEIDWQGSHALQGRLNALLQEQRGTALTVTRIARIYDERFVFLIKPDRRRYWLGSTALRDADETMADLRHQGF